MDHHQSNGRVFDARPDRIDFRDRIYRPPLVSLPGSFPLNKQIAAYLPKYHQTSKILDQKNEGACTGFGLAAVINYISWDRWMRSHNGVADTTDKPNHVSPWMLYDNARIYDEWEGEDYSGSSCRGAMKGWHKHGVCRDELWQRRTRGNNRPNPDWSTDASLRPLGAYYRIESDSIADMQSAIHEVRAIYCSARVHDGWFLNERHSEAQIGELVVPIIAMESEITGGHAFALVGYTPDGFIVQNSWGAKWGMNGFALLTYEDWARNGDDAWVAAMAAPTRIAGNVTVPASRSRKPMQFTTSASAPSPAEASGITPWTHTAALEHAVVMGNDGKLLRRLIDTEHAADNLHKVVVELPSQAIAAGTKHVVLFAHGGLNSEGAAIERTMKMGPWFEANGIYPIFIVWRTSLLESIGQIGQDIVDPFLKQREELRARGLGDIFDRIQERIQNQFDKAFEAVAEKVIGKAVWSQMKQNARAAANGSGGSRQIVLALRELRQAHPNISIHVLGHSAGAILLGHMLDDLDANSAIKTAGLYAPACSMEFAVKHYGRALKSRVLHGSNFHIDNLSIKNERDDSVGPYGKSLLFLVSRALEDPRKMPLLGLTQCWNPASDNLNDLKDALATDFAASHIKDIRDWNRLVLKHKIQLNILADREVVTRTSNHGVEQIASEHSCFDNSLAILNASVSRILGTASPHVEITDLTGF